MHLGGLQTLYRDWKNAPELNTRPRKCSARPREGEDSRNTTDAKTRPRKPGRDRVKPKDAPAQREDATARCSGGSCLTLMRGRVLQCAPACSRQLPYSDLFPKIYLYMLSLSFVIRFISIFLARF